MQCEIDPPQDTGIGTPKEPCDHHDTADPEHHQQEQAGKQEVRDGRPVQPRQPGADRCAGAIRDERHAADEAPIARYVSKATSSHTAIGRRVRRRVLIVIASIPISPLDGPWRRVVGPGSCVTRVCSPPQLSLARAGSFSGDPLPVAATATSPRPRSVPRGRVAAKGVRAGPRSRIRGPVIQPVRRRGRPQPRAGQPRLQQRRSRGAPRLSVHGWAAEPSDRASSFFLFRAQRPRHPER
jgi:hypothetical protein